MKYAIILVLLSLLSLALLGPNSGDIEVTERTKEAVQAAINSCPRGLGPRTASCAIRLPSGQILGSWVIGGDTPLTNQVGVCLIGHGAGWGSVWYPDGGPGASGTTLVYDGPPGGILLDVHSADKFCLRDLTLAIDGAAIGVRLVANNAAGATIQTPMFERVDIQGNMRHPCGTAIQITGAARNDQVDALLMQSSSIYNVDVGIETTSHQAVMNRIGPGVKISAQTAAVRMKRGSLTLDGVLAQCRTVNCCTYDLTTDEPYYLRVRDGYHEIGLQPAQGAALMCLPSLPNFHRHAVSITESVINVQCDSTQAPCTVDLVRGASIGSVTFRDNELLAAGGSQPDKGRRARVALDSGAIASPPLLVWSGNTVSKALTLLSAIGGTVRVEALAVDSSRVWNDRNLNGKLDLGEATMVKP